MQKDANRSEIEMLKKAGAQEFPMVIVDENAPFPSEIESTETVVLPEIQSMTEYIRRHYERKIIAELEKRIRFGKLGVIQEGRLLRNPDRSIQTALLFVNPLPKKNSFVWANYRRVAECCMNNRIAADAAAWALSKVGCPYSQEKRNQDGVFDCSSLVARAYAAQGKRWRYGGSVPRSNQEVYDDDFELLWPEKYSEIGKKFGGADVLERANQPGDLQFLCTDSGTSRLNRITHVAMVADVKNIVHARGKAYGVCVNRLAHYAGKVCAVARFNSEGALRVGMKGWRTLALQQKLNALGASLETDGEYGNTTAGAVKAFQHARNLPATGEADRATLEALGLAAADSGSGTENVVRITGDTVNVRRGPGTDYESIAIAHKGDTLPAVAADGWQPVLFGGEIRWVSMKYTSLELAK